MGRFYIAIALVFIATFLSEKTLANIIIAEAGNSGKTIANAIQSAQNGDTVLIKSGIYKEQSLKLKKSITLLGENLPVIDGENKYENLTVEHDSVIIKGIKFINSGSSNFNDIAALTIQNSKHLLIEDCQFENNFFGILSMNCGYITYNNNKLSSGGIKGKPLANGIHCWKSNHLTITNNTIKGHRDGIYLEFTTQSKFENNRSIKNSRYGMHFMFSHDNFYQHNEFIANGAGVAVMYSKRVEMRYNLFADSWGSAAYGVLLKEINDSKIIGNEFRGNTISIFADGANRIEIYNNLFLKGGWALKVNASCADMQVNGNNFIGNTFDIATNGGLKMKSMNANYWDKYEGYDLNKDKVGDVPFHPLSLFSVIAEKNPPAMLLYRSFMVSLLDKSERVLPSITPDNIVDNHPQMRPYVYDRN